MSESYHVRIAKEELIFSAAHFITYGDNVCERLHGHNYGVCVDVHGPLDENQYVIDFIALRDLLKAILQRLDHFVLLPTKHPLIQVRQEGAEVVATFAQRRWVFPQEDCVLLPVANTTAELLARHIGLELTKRLVDEQGLTPTELSVAVDECAGQIGTWHWIASR